MKKLLCQYRAFLLVILFDIIITVFSPHTGRTIFRYTLSNFKEMLAVIPPIFLLLGLLDVWVPRETIIRFLGPSSGAVGIGLSILLGAAAAGPLYGAFPVTAVMARKGARFSNILVFLGSWATLKIPMFLFEMSALGPGFAILRAALNIPGIILLALVLERLLDQEEISAFYARHAEEA